MIRQTGGAASGATSTRSSPSSSASLRAASGVMIPSCAPEEPMTRTSRALIRSLTRVFRMDSLSMDTPEVGPDRTVHRCQADGEGAGVMLDQRSEEALQRAQHRAMDHHDRDFLRF